MLYTKRGLNFEWGVDDNIVWIIDRGEGLPAIVYMEEILGMLRGQLGSLINVNILCKSIMGRWDAVHIRQGSTGYDVHSLGEVITYEDAKQKIAALFGPGEEVPHDGPWATIPSSSAVMQAAASSVGA